MAHLGSATTSRWLWRGSRPSDKPVRRHRGSARGPVRPLETGPWRGHCPHSGPPSRLGISHPPRVSRLFQVPPVAPLQLCPTSLVTQPANGSPLLCKVRTLFSGSPHAGAPKCSPSPAAGPLPLTAQCAQCERWASIQTVTRSAAPGHAPPPLSEGQAGPLTPVRCTKAGGSPQAPHGAGSYPWHACLFPKDLIPGSEGPLTERGGPRPFPSSPDGR